KDGFANEIKNHFENVFLQVIEKEDSRMSDLSLLTSAEKLQLLTDFNDTKTIFPTDKTVLDLFAAQVIKTPDALALVFNQETLTYQELDQRSTQLAHYLKGRGVKEETLVPVCINRSIEMMTAILGILKAGGAYVPIDPGYPQERIDYMLEDTGATIVVCSTENAAKFPDAKNIDTIEIDGDWPLITTPSKGDTDIAIQPHHLAYVIYTSGSTGKPKGVMIAHSSLLHYLLNNKTRYIGEKENNAGSYIHLSYTFDASLTAMFMPLLFGKPVVIGSRQSMDIFEDSNLLKYAPYDFIKITPSHLELLLPQFKAYKQGLLTEKLVIGGEALHHAQFNSYMEEGIDVEIINEYGPTEATVGCTTYSFHTIEDNEKIKNGISIGKPIDNTLIYIVDNTDKLVPVGVKGELCIGGAGVARGYLNRPELTAEKFINDPFSDKPGDKIYKTGDICRWLPDGNIEYIGRVDEQVKIRGYRIEISEIENVLQQCNLVKQGVVLARQDKEGIKRLIGYVVPNEAFDKEAILAYLKTRLPEYMLPRLWVPLESFSLTNNGKIDRNSLPDPDAGALLNNQFVAPRNELELKLADIWKEILM
ncbi:MAG: amino acid adenylation domain-containing protein, partial [Ferruginibacter sp.]|nr:amino acid adenylation domain-containing protein [Chitinophagaceae bacterium]